MLVARDHQIGSSSVGLLLGSFEPSSRTVAQLSLLVGKAVVLMSVLRCASLGLTVVEKMLRAIQQLVDLTIAGHRLGRLGMGRLGHV